MTSRNWRVLPVVASVAAVALLFTTGCAAWRIGQAADLARKSTPFQQSPADVALSLLIVGDSTGVGTGASSPEASLAGLLGRAYPRLRIDNRARDGATFADVLRQLQGAQRYDLVLVQAGGNDVIRRTCAPTSTGPPSWPASAPTVWCSCPRATWAMHRSSLHPPRGS